MSRHLHIDIETYSDTDLLKCGLYKYTEDPSFAIQLFAYAYDNLPVRIIDLTKEDLPSSILQDLTNPGVTKHAHNAIFEMRCLSVFYNIELSAKQWECSLVKCAYCGRHLSLKLAAISLKVPSRKDSAGTKLINLFAKPCKPTKSNGRRTQNLPEHFPEKWEEYKSYCITDVETERDISNALRDVELPAAEIDNYMLDMQINERGILVDGELAQRAAEIDKAFTSRIFEELSEATGCANPRSGTQFKQYLLDEHGMNVKSLIKKVMPDVYAAAEEVGAVDVIKKRELLTRSSTKKYAAILSYAGEDQRARGLFQFYGANRTGRWAGRGVQLQNLPQNHIPDLELARNLVLSGDAELLGMFYDNTPDILSQLIRTAFIAKPDHTFVVADFSAIEARVISWLANEEWRLEVFRTHGKIYEASAAMMFKVPIEQIHKGSPERQKGKIAELALGFGGSTGALGVFGKEFGWSEPEKKRLVKLWRNANPAVVSLWDALNQAALSTVASGHTNRVPVGIPENGYNITFRLEHNCLTMELLSGRKLFYPEPKLMPGKYGDSTIFYLDSSAKADPSDPSTAYTDTYGGKLAENLTQATARDALADTMRAVNARGHAIVMHVHDELVCEVPKVQAKAVLTNILDLMKEPVPWAAGLPLKGDGYITDFYKKD